MRITPKVEGRIYMKKEKHRGYVWICGTYEPDFILDVLYVDDSQVYMITVQEGKKCSTMLRHCERTAVLQEYENLLDLHSMGKRILT